MRPLRVLWYGYLKLWRLEDIPVDRFATAPLRVRLANGLEVEGAHELAAPFMAQLADPARGVLAVVVYGSCLWAAVRRGDSEPDFLVVVESLRRWHRRPGEVVLGAVLPPSVYHLRGELRSAKLCVVSRAQLARETSRRARDLHLAGRLSKRVALAFARDDAARQLILDAQMGALQTVAWMVLGRLPERFELDDFIGALLAISYEGERRMVEPGKVAALFAAERDHYRAVARELLSLLGAQADGEGLFCRSSAEACAPERVAAFLRRSRRRALERWPKYLLTFDGWLEYLLAKCERAGFKVALTPRQQRHPLLFGWPALLRLKKDGYIR